MANESADDFTLEGAESTDMPSVSGAADMPEYGITKILAAEQSAMPGPATIFSGPKFDIESTLMYLAVGYIHASNRYVEDGNSCVVKLTEDEKDQVAELNVITKGMKMEDHNFAILKFVTAPMVPILGCFFDRYLNARCAPYYAMLCFHHGVGGNLHFYSYSRSGTGRAMRCFHWPTVDGHPNAEQPATDMMRDVLAKVQSDFITLGVLVPDRSSVALKAAMGHERRFRNEVQEYMPVSVAIERYLHGHVKTVVDIAVTQYDSAEILALPSPATEHQSARPAIITEGIYLMLKPETTYYVDMMANRIFGFRRGYDARTGINVPNNRMSCTVCDVFDLKFANSVVTSASRSEVTVAMRGERKAKSYVNKMPLQHGVYTKDGFLLAGTFLKDDASLGQKRHLVMVHHMSQHMRSVLIAASQAPQKKHEPAVELWQVCDLEAYS